MSNIAELILEFNQSNHLEKGLKNLTPNKMLRRLPIFLAQLKAEKILKNSKMKLGNYCIPCTDKKNLQICLLNDLIVKPQITKILDWLI